MCGVIIIGVNVCWTGIVSRRNVKTRKGDKNDNALFMRRTCFFGWKRDHASLFSEEVMKCLMKSYFQIGNRKRRCLRTVQCHPARTTVGSPPRGMAPATVNRAVLQGSYFGPASSSSYSCILPATTIVLYCTVL